MDLELEALAAEFEALQNFGDPNEPSKEMGKPVITKRGGGAIAAMLLRGVPEGSLIMGGGGEFLVTPERLRMDCVDELEAVDGRIRLQTLAQRVGVPVRTAEKAVGEVCTANTGMYFLVDNDFLDLRYVKGLAVEMSALLDASSRGCIRLADLAARFGLPESFVLDTVLALPELKKYKHSFASGLVYGDTFAVWLKSRARGAVRSLTRPIAVQTIASVLDMDEQELVQQLTELIRTGEVNGVLDSGQKNYVPNCYANARVQWVEGFFRRNGFIELAMMNKYGFANPRVYLASMTPKPFILPEIALSPTYLDIVTESVKSAVEDNAVLDISQLLPSSMSLADVESVGKHCSSDGVMILGKKFAVPSKIISEMVTKLENWVGTPPSADGSALVKSLIRGVRQAKKTTSTVKYVLLSEQNTAKAVLTKLKEWYNERDFEGESMSVLADYLVQAMFRICVAFREKENDMETKQATERVKQFSEQIANQITDVWLFLEAVNTVPSEYPTVERHFRRTLLSEAALTIAQMQCSVLGVDYATIVPKEGKPEGDKVCAAVVAACKSSERANDETLGQIQELCDVLRSETTMTMEQLVDARDNLMDLSARLGVRVQVKKLKAERLRYHSESFETLLMAENRPGPALQYKLILLNLQKRGLFLPVPPRCVHVLVGLVESTLNDKSAEFVRTYHRVVVNYLRTKDTQLQEYLTQNLTALKTLS